MKLLQIILVSGFLVAATLLPVRAQGPGSSPQWVNFWSVNSPLQVGDVVRAYDSTGILCGEAFVSVAGSYGFLACALDDPNTAADEGVTPGGQVHFTINDLPVAPIFTLPSALYNGIAFEVDLGGTIPSRSASKPSCIDGYENDDTKATASSITGPEAHTFYSRKRGWDQDWGSLTANAGYVYQIQARSPQPFSITQPVLRLYDANGVLLAENDMDKWGRGAEIWWWNGSRKTMTLYLLAEEKQGQFGCRHYTLTVTPWSPAEFAARFGK
jgi:hypothetical protein